ncbi:MAG: O-antigen ligase family protein, partial [Ignavibacteriaceae bacterium]|nr:O-antigen ligase family protein [Ignavibacteriaceae bacterium]
MIVYDVVTKGFVLFSIQTNSFNQFAGLYSNPNAIGLQLSVSLPMLIGLMFFKKGSKASTNYLYYFLLIFSLIVLLLTNSRASIGAVFVSISYILFKLKRRYFKYFFIGIVVSALAFFLIPILNDFIALYLRVDRVFENTRFYIWTMSIDIIKSHYIFGVGPEQFATKIYANLPVMLGSFEEFQIWWAKSGTSHNFFLYRFTETGILGFFSALYLFYTFFKISSMVEKLTKFKEPRYYILSVSISSIGAGLLGRAFLESTGLITNGWITRDLPFWIAFMILIHLY